MSLRPSRRGRYPEPWHIDASGSSVLTAYRRSSPEIFHLILRQCIGLTAVGIALGLVLTIAAGLSLRHLLYNVSPFDPITFVGAIAVITFATAVASLIPAVAASRVEPRAALED
jgi:ABC-type antimicrobial peptide transport system permease subunit